MSLSDTSNNNQITPSESDIIIQQSSTSFHNTSLNILDDTLVITSHTEGIPNDSTSLSPPSLLTNPTSAFILYMAERKVQNSYNWGSLSDQEITQICLGDWDKMGEEDKLSFDRASQATTQGDMLQSEDVKEDQPPMLGTNKPEITGYSVFSQRILTKLLTNNPNMSIQDLNYKLEEEWDQLPVDKQNIFNNHAITQGGSASYESNNKRSSPESPTLESQTFVSGGNNDEYQGEETFKILPFPMRPYMQFVQANRLRIKNKFPNLDAIRIGKAMGEEWRSLKEEEKSIYQDRFKVDHAIYKKQMSINERITGRKEKMYRKRRVDKNKGLAFNKQQIKYAIDGNIYGLQGGISGQYRNNNNYEYYEGESQMEEYCGHNWGGRIIRGQGSSNSEGYNFEEKEINGQSNTPEVNSVSYSPPHYTIQEIMLAIGC